MNDLTFRKIAVAAMAAAADIMDTTDQDDRRHSEVVLVEQCKALILAANAGDTDARDILTEGVPSWFPKDRSGMEAYLPVHARAVTLEEEA